MIRAIQRKWLFEAPSTCGLCTCRLQPFYPLVLLLTWFFFFWQWDQFKAFFVTFESIWVCWRSCLVLSVLSANEQLPMIQQYNDDKKIQTTNIWNTTIGYTNNFHSGFSWCLRSLICAPYDVIGFCPLHELTFTLTLTFCCWFLFPAFSQKFDLSIKIKWLKGDFSMPNS